MAKIERADLLLTFDMSDKVKETTYYIDLAQCLSIINRRNYHQRMYHIRKIDVFAVDNLAIPDLAARFGVTCCPNTWVVANAWVKAKAAWKKSRAQVLRDTPDIQGKWDSFKVYLNAEHAQKGVAANLTQAGSIAGEWDMSSLIMPDWVSSVQPPSGDIFNMHILGDDTTVGVDLKSAGLVQGYSEVRPLVSLKDTQPDIGDSWITRLFDLGGQESELADIIVDEGDEPPYARDEYIGTDSNVEISLPGYGTISSYVPQHTIPGFYVPGGVIGVTGFGDMEPYESPPAVGGLKMGFQIHLTPGTYKGVHAIPMRQ